MHAEILTYSRSRGLFAGIAIDGAVIKQDKDGNERVYGDAVSPKALLFTPGQGIPPAGKALVDALREISPEKIGP
jgi:lipid-binding SYLF domain-containing protein